MKYEAQTDESTIIAAVRALAKTHGASCVIPKRRERKPTLRPVVLAAQRVRLGEEVLGYLKTRTITPSAALYWNKPSLRGWYAVLQDLFDGGTDCICLLAVRSPIDLERFLPAIRRHQGPVFVWHTEAAARVEIRGRHLDRPLPPLAIGEVLPALGIPVLRSVEELTAATSLYLRGVRPLTGAVGLVSNSPDSREILHDAVERFAIPIAEGADFLVRDATEPKRAREKGYTAPQRATALLKARSLDCIIVAGAPALRLSIPQLHLSARSQRRKDMPLTLAELSALSALLRAGPERRLPPQPDDATNRPQMDQHVGAIEIQYLAKTHHLPMTPQHTVTSASAAGRIGGDHHGSIRFRPLPPRTAAPKDLPELTLEDASASGARQAFRDILHQCSQLRPPPEVEGVLLTAYPSAARYWHGHVMVISISARTLLALSVSDRRQSNGHPRITALPSNTSELNSAARQLIATIPSNLASTHTLPSAQRLLETLCGLIRQGELTLDWLRLDLSVDERGKLTIVDGAGWGGF